MVSVANDPRDHDTRLYTHKEFERFADAWNERELAHAARSFLVSLVGAHQYKRWLSLKQQKSMKTDSAFMKWLLDCAENMETEKPTLKEPEEMLATPDGISDTVAHLEKGGTEVLGPESLLGMISPKRNETSSEKFVPTQMSSQQLQCKSSTTNQENKAKLASKNRHVSRKQSSNTTTSKVAANDKERAATLTSLPEHFQSAISDPSLFGLPILSQNIVPPTNNNTTLPPTNDHAIRVTNLPSSGHHSSNSVPLTPMQLVQSTMSPNKVMCTAVSQMVSQSGSDVSVLSALNKSNANSMFTAQMVSAVPLMLGGAPVISSEKNSSQSSKYFLPPEALSSMLQQDDNELNVEEDEWDVASEPTCPRWMEGDDGKEKAFFCQRCSFKTKTKWSLQRHQLLHSNSKPYSCTMCAFKARQKVHLRKHMRSTHGESKQFRCLWCTFEAFEQDILMEHAVRRHPRQTQTGSTTKDCFTAKDGSTAKDGFMDEDGSTAKDHSTTKDEAYRLDLDRLYPL